MVLVFNSKRRVLKTNGFPVLFKEIAEILECGDICDYRSVEFIQSVEKFASIEQRWGL